MPDGASGQDGRADTKLPIDERYAMTTIGILTSGGDCPGLNAVIRGAVLKGTEVHGQEFVGFLDGWRGLVEGDAIPWIAAESVVLARRAAPSSAPPVRPLSGTARRRAEQFRQTLDRLGVDAVVAIGGEGTRSGVEAAVRGAGSKIVGVPKTIDNDLEPHRLHLRLRHRRGDRHRRRSTGCAPPANRTSGAWSSR